MGRQNFGDHNNKNFVATTDAYFDEQFDDTRIYQDVVEGFFKSTLSTEDVVVTVDKGIVFLRGKIDALASKEKVEEFVIQVAGVKDVRNELYIEQ